MHRNDGPPREVALPASVFATLRRELTREVGAVATIHALHAAGYSAGSAAAPGFASAAGGGTAELATDVFWARFTAFLARRGWGRLTHAPAHEAVGLLRSGDWVEADEERGEEAACSFTAGYLSGMLTELAGGPVAVLETECRARGDERCTFAFGSEGAIHELYGRLLDGAGLDGALAAL